MARLYKFALITGASSGIGEAIANQLPEETSLILTGRNQDRLEALATKLKLPSRNVITLVGDLTERDFRRQLMERASQYPVDLVINNAGIGDYGMFADANAKQTTEMLSLNIAAVTDLAHGMMPSLEMHKGAMVIVASVVGFMPIPGFAVYSATKAYDLYLAEALAVEMKPHGVHILALCPGGTATQFQQRAGAQQAEGIFTDSPQKVARECLQALARGKHVHVVGMMNRLLIFIMRFLPRSVVRNIAGRVLQGARRIAS